VGDRRLAGFLVELPFDRSNPLIRTTSSGSVAAERLGERSVPCDRLHRILFTGRRLGTQDPAGNRVLLKQAWPGGPL
jgi:hypothetical protein